MGINTKFMGKVPGIRLVGGGDAEYLPALGLKPGDQLLGTAYEAGVSG